MDRATATPVYCGSIRSAPSFGTGRQAALVAAYEFAKAKVTGEKPDLGENRKATVEM